MAIKINRYQANHGLEFSIYPDKAGKWRWRLESVNGNILADSGEGYSQKSTCVKIVLRLKERLASASVRKRDKRTGRWVAWHRKLF